MQRTIFLWYFIILPHREASSEKMDHVNKTLRRNHRPCVIRHVTLLEWYDVLLSRFFFFFACIYYNTYCTYVYTYILRAFFTWNTSLTYRTGKQKQCPFWMKSMICAVLVDDKNEESNSRVICQTHSKNVKGQKLWHAAMLYVSFFLFVLFFSFSLVKRHV